MAAMANYRDIDFIFENLYLGNINAAANLNLLKKLVINDSAYFKPNSLF